MTRLALVTLVATQLPSVAAAQVPDAGIYVPPGVELRPLAREEQLRMQLSEAQGLVMFGDLEAAADLAESARAELQKLGDKDGACMALAVGAGIRSNAEQYDAAIADFNQALACAHDARFRDRLNEAIASVRIDSGDLDGARRGFEELLKTTPEDPPKPRIETLAQLGWIAMTEGDPVKAEAYFARAQAIMDKWSTPSETRWHVDYWLQRRRVWLDATRGRIDRAVEAMRQATEYADDVLREQISEMTEREMLMAKMMVEYELNTAIALNAGPGEKSPAAAKLALTNILRTKGLALEALAGRQRLVRASWSPDIERDLVELQAKRAELARLTLSGGSPRTRARAMAELARDADRLEMTAYGKAARAEYRASTGPEQVKLEDVQRAVPDGAALIELERFRPYVLNGRSEHARWGAPRYAAYVLLKRGDPRFVDLGDAQEIDRKIVALRNALSTPQGDVRRQARRLDELLMQPVRALVGDARQLFIAPAGLLNLLPFDALVDEDDRWLTERWSISYVASGRDLRPSESRKSRGPAAVIGGASFDDRASKVAHARRSLDLRQVYFIPLPGTLDEVKSVGGLLDGAQLFTGRNATKRALEQLHGPRVLHVATHAFFLADQSAPLLDKTPKPVENPLLRAGLALAGANLEHTGGIVTALEVAGLDLDGTRLVVLSACETGVGGVLTDEGVAGLLRALVVAGAETQVVSLWKVDDEATRRLMIDYYQRLKKGGGRGEAMRQVRLAMLARAATRHPYYWASFAVWGRVAKLDDGGKP